MCGILIIKSDKISNKVKKNFINSLKYMKNRGPDESKFINKKNILIGFNRLSINEIKSGSQPYISECGRYTVVFNGEILNYLDLIKDLKLQGIKVKYNNEVEVILKYYLIYKDKCINFFKGFFAFVIYDNLKNSIFSAVDRLGIKPLYFFLSKNKKFFIISSDYSHLVRFKIINLKIDEDSLMNFMCLGRTFQNKTIYKNIYELGPGSKLFLSKQGNIKIIKYWSPFKANKNIYLNENNQRKNFLKKFIETNKLWKISETKISTTISSGVDSKIIDYTFKKNKINLKRFNIIEDKKELKTKNKIISEKINYNLVLKEMNKFTSINKNPFVLANPGSIALFQLYKKIKSYKYKVSFTGEGGDELFGGYDRYKDQYNLLLKKVKFDKHLIELYKREINLFTNYQKKRNKKIIHQNLKRNINTVNLKSSDSKSKILEFDQLTWLPMLLRKHDTIGMNYSIEVRPQFLDHQIVEMINNQISSKLKFSNKESKILLKKILLFNTGVNFFNKKKLGTPTIQNLIFSERKKLAHFKKSILNSKFLKKIFSKKLFKDESLFKLENSIFLWRLYILSLIFAK